MRNRPSAFPTHCQRAWAASAGMSARRGAAGSAGDPAFCDGAGGETTSVTPLASASAAASPLPDGKGGVGGGGDAAASQPLGLLAAARAKLPFFMHLSR